MKKIKLSKESLRVLTGQEIREVGGGATGGQQFCQVNTNNVQDCVQIQTRLCPQPTHTAICQSVVCSVTCRCPEYP